MPCISPTAEDLARAENEDQLRSDLREREAMLCLALTILQENGLSLEKEIDDAKEAEAGVTYEQIRDWWHEHQAKDRARREQEREAQREHETALAAYNKLTPLERKLLKVKKPD